MLFLTFIFHPSISIKTQHRNFVFQQGFQAQGKAEQHYINCDAPTQVDSLNEKQYLIGENQRALDAGIDLRLEQTVSAKYTL